MPSAFEPDEREKLLIQEATRLANRDSGPSRYATAELVVRMTSEGLHVNGTEDDSQTDGRDGNDRPGPPLNLEAQRREESLPAESSVCRVVLAAAVNTAEDVPLTRPEIAARYSMANCVAAHVFKVPPHVVLLEFDQQVSHRDAAMVASVEAVLRTFPRAEFIDLPGQNSLIELLVDASGEMAPDQMQLETMYRCTMPSDELVALAASAVDGLLAQRDVGARLVEAEVFEVHPDFGIAHLTTPDGRLLCVTERTPGIGSLSQVEDGQRYRCWVQGRSNLVARAELAG